MRIILLGLGRGHSEALRALSPLREELGLIARTSIVAHKYPQLKCQGISCALQSPQIEHSQCMELHAGKTPTYIK